ncbi:oxidoreductase [Rhizorhabdus sp.]|uniref:oxidoreductase n=1 Tax=Rhizorhabdus sp. TaxID=1968843 RepID=UPI0019960A18|nr:oxidoreductase [Rhizorhabdus sp.]MBD3760399.1 SDR family NAD(P)-dependent oxidoreductase [Rhizorhabdus sp.]
MANWFVTGVSTGLGRALAEAALAKGDTVVGTVRAADQVTAFDLLAPGRAHGLLMDVTNEEMVRDAIDRAERLTGGLNVVVNNAGRGLTGAVEETSLDEARALFEVNIFGPLAVIRAALPYLRSRKSGHIVNITSVSGLAAWAGTGIYGASKFALECIGRTLAQELEPLGIHVTNVAPGGLRTEFAGEALADVGSHIADYAPTAHQARPTLIGHRGQEPSEPALAAKAIIAAVEAAQPPLLLLLGTDALKYAEHEFDALRADITLWKPVTLAVAADR